MSGVARTDRMPAGSVAARVRAAWADVLADRPDAPVDPQQPFLAAGGHSMAAARLLVRLREDVGVEVPMAAVLRDDPSLAELVAVVEARLAAPAGEPTPPVEPARPRVAASPRRSAPLAPTLRRVWAWHRLHPGSPAYNVVRVLTVDGRVEPAPLRAALADLVARHEALRCAVAEPRPGEPEVVVHERVAVPLSVEVVRRPDGERQAAVDAALQRIADRPFPLDKAPLWRVGAVYVPSADRTWLVLVMHHLVSDLRSTNVVLAELVQAYAARAAGAEPAFEAPAPSLLAHLEHETRLAGTARRDQHLDWWSRHLAGAVPTGPLPLSTAGGDDRDFAGSTRTFELPADDSDALDRALREQGLTPAIFFLTAASAVLAAWTGQDRAEVVGVPSVRMSRAEDERLVGFLLDTLLLPVAPDHGRSFRAAYQAVRDAYADAADHALPAFDDIVHRLKLPRTGTGRTPLVRLWFNDLTQVRAPSRLGDLPMAEYDLPPAWALFDIGLYVRRGPAGYRLHLVTPRGGFREADAAELLDQVVRTAVRAGSDTARPVGELLALPEETALGGDAPHTAAVPSTADLVARHGRARPSAPALVDAEGTLDVATLDRLADDLARTVRAAAGPRAVVAVPARRDRLFVVRLLACRRAGTTVALVDAGWPPERRRRALETAGVTHAFPWLGDGPLARIGAGAEPAPRPAGGAEHVLLTSGTTGDPVAVRVSTAVTDAALADLVDRLGIRAGDRVSMLSGPAHDPVLRDLGLALRAGATVCVPPPVVFTNPGLLGAWLRRERVSVVNATPVMLALALGADPEPLPDLRVVVCGGSPLSAATAELIRSRAPRAMVVNGYGCTETPQLVALHELGPEHPVPPFPQVPVGVPLPGRRIEVRTPDGRRCAAGQLGELWIAEPHIAQGYCAAAATSATDRFVTDAAGLRWLRTGDLARRDAAGLLHLAGRTDRQVLVNGYRVTLDEVESVARGCAGVVDAVAGIVGDAATGQALRIWVQPAAAAGVTEEDVRAHLAALLPAAAVPVRVHVVDRLAVTENLKPRPPEAGASPAGGAGVRSGPDRRLQELAESIVGGPVDPATNFFDAGLTSVSLLQMCAELTDVLGRPVEALHVFERPNLVSLSAFLFGSTPPEAPAPADPTPAVDRAARVSQVRSSRREARRRVQELGPRPPAPQ